VLLTGGHQRFAFHGWRARRDDDVVVLRQQ
jgi:hypothetical protein